MSGAPTTTTAMTAVTAITTTTMTAPPSTVQRSASDRTALASSGSLRAATSRTPVASPLQQNWQAIKNYTRTVLQGDSWQFCGPEKFFAVYTTK